MTQRQVLLVDDDPDIRSAMAEALEDEGYVVVCAENGQVALDYLSHTQGDPPAVILLDLMMPTMNGWEFLHERDRDPSLAEIPVAILTAGERFDVPEGLPLDHCLAKPCDLGDVLSLVERYCRRS